MLWPNAHFICVTIETRDFICMETGQSRRFLLYLSIDFFLAVTAVLSIFQSGSPSRSDSKAPEAPHTKNGVSIRSVRVTQKIDLNRPHF